MLNLQPCFLHFDYAQRIALGVFDFRTHFDGAQRITLGPFF